MWGSRQVLGILAVASPTMRDPYLLEVVNNPSTVAAVPLILLVISLQSTIT